MKKKLIYNTALLTGASLVMRTIGISFQVWLVGRIGAPGIGLFQLVMSVSGLAVTFSISGIRYACTRLVSEEMGLGAYGGVNRVMRRCMAYSSFFGISCAAILFFCAEPVGFLWIGDARTVLPLRIYSVSLPFISLGSVIAGYFTAMGRVYKTAAVNIAEQLLRISLVVLFLRAVPQGELELSCAAVVSAGTTAEVFSFILLMILFYFDRRRHAQPGTWTPKLTSRMLGVALPLALSAYARTSLSTLEHLLVPRGLKSAGLSSDMALSGYGTIQGMVFPIIFFPSSFLMALAELIVPDLTEAQMMGRTDYISATASSLLDKCVVFALGTAAILFTFSKQLGLAVYNSADAGRYIAVFSFLAPVIYLDMVTDGILKGLGQQMYSMGVNIADSLISVALVYTLLPRYALTAYILIICFTECFNSSLSIIRLTKIVDLRINLPRAVLAAFAAAGAAQCAQFITAFIGLDTAGSLSGVLSAVGLSACIFSALIYLLHTVMNPSPGVTAN